MEKEKVLKSWNNFETYLIQTIYAVRNPESGEPVESEWNHLVKRFAGELKKVNSLKKVLTEKETEEIITAIKHRYIIPASPFLMTFGNPYTRRRGYFSCYPLGYVQDSMDGIYEMCTKMKEVYIRGGGVGIDISKLRPRNSPVDSRQGISSGPAGFLHLFDAVTGTTNQGGRRRGALLVQMHWKHPDIEKFIKAKSLVPQLSGIIYSAPEEERMDVPLQNMNLSVAVDREFFSSERGKKLYQVIAEQMWKSGDPGLLFVDNMRKYSPFNPAFYGESDDPAFSNPCGEYLAPANTACNLITVNVAKIAYETFLVNGKGVKDFFSEVAGYSGLALLLGSLLVEADEGYPLEEIRITTQRLKPVGVGMTGFHTALLLAYDGNVCYGDEKAIEFAKATQASLTLGTLTKSALLAERFNHAYRWNESFLEQHLHELEEETEKQKLPFREEIKQVKETAEKFRGFYNAVTTSQPPTGSVSQFARVGGDTGIEPMYAIELKRRVRDFYTSTWKEVTVVTQYLIEKLQDRNFRKKLEKQLAYNISPAEQLQMVEAFQRFIHTGVSKTINVPENTTVEEIRKLIEYSRNARLKGFTVFRENCRVDTVYIPGKKAEEKEELSPVRKAFVYEVKGTTNVYITTSLDENNRIREVFISVGKAGTTLNGMFQAFGRVISVALRHSPELIERFIKTLEGIETGEFYVCNSIHGKSIPDITAKILKHALKTVKNRGPEEPENSKQPHGDLCPACGRLSLRRDGNCKTCTICGFTTC